MFSVVHQRGADSGIARIVSGEDVGQRTACPQGDREGEEAAVDFLPRAALRGSDDSAQVQVEGTRAQKSVSAVTVQVDAELRNAKGYYVVGSAEEVERRCAAASRGGTLKAGIRAVVR